MGVGLLVGAAVGLVLAPMRGGQMRAALRSRADQARQQGMMLLEEGRRAFRTSHAPIDAERGTLTATLGEIAQLHTGSTADTYEAQS
jgi:gas vesicle protein